MSDVGRVKFTNWKNRRIDREVYYNDITVESALYSKALVK